jgi:hypothetical protein
MNPLLHLFAKRPQLLLDHAQAYAELAAARVEHTAAEWKHRVVLAAVALCGLLLAAMLGGVALMLGAVMVAPQAPSQWILIATPAVPALVGVCCLVALQMRRASGTADALRQQIQADLLIWRAAEGTA